MAFSFIIRVTVKSSLVYFEPTYPAFLSSSRSLPLLLSSGSELKNLALLSCREFKLKFEIKVSVSQIAKGSVQFNIGSSIPLKSQKRTFKYVSMIDIKKLF